MHLMCIMNYACASCVLWQRSKANGCNHGTAFGKCCWMSVPKGEMPVYCGTTKAQCCKRLQEKLWYSLRWPRFYGARIGSEVMWAVTKFCNWNWQNHRSIAGSNRIHCIKKAWWGLRICRESLNTKGKGQKSQLPVEPALKNPVQSHRATLATRCCKIACNGSNDWTAWVCGRVRGGRVLHPKATVLEISRDSCWKMPDFVWLRSHILNWTGLKCGTHSIRNMALPREIIKAAPQASKVQDYFWIESSAILSASALEITPKSPSLI